MMLRRLNKRLRLRAALALAALYAFCILLPNAALAFSANARAHCVTETGPAHVHAATVEPAKTHVHSDGSVHTHATKAALTHDDAAAPHADEGDHGKKHAGSCCGLFCISALAHEPPAVTTTVLSRGHTVPVHTYALAGRGPSRINRPPIG
jgi:hypothetical protein